MISGVGGWLEGVALVGFVVVNFSAVFVALYWGLGRDSAPPEPPADRGAMSEAGVPYVPGPPGI